MEQILSRQNLLDALHKVESSKGAAGIDEVSIEDLREYVQPIFDPEFSLLTYTKPSESPTGNPEDSRV